MEQLALELRCVCDPALENRRAHAFERAQLAMLEGEHA